MDYYAGIDVSLELSSVCVVDANGKILREAKVASDPESLSAFFRELGLSLSRIGMEAGPLSQWLHAGLVSEGFAVVLLETRHVKAALSAMTVKTDRRDARGIAQLLRMGWFRPVHCKSLPSQDIRTLLSGRKLLLSKVIDVELSIRGLLRGFGLKMGQISQGRFAARVCELAVGQPMLESVTEAMLRSREVLRTEVATLHRQVLAHGAEPAGYLPAAQSHTAGLDSLLREVLSLGPVSGLQTLQQNVGGLGDGEVSAAQEAQDTGQSLPRNRGGEATASVRTLAERNRGRVCLMGAV